MNKYKEEIIAQLRKDFNYANIMQVPKIEKIVVNMGVGEATQNVKLLDEAEETLTAITGQKPVITRARRSIAGFKLREGNPIGCMVTLRGERMYEFLDRVINVVLPAPGISRGYRRTASTGAAISAWASRSSRFSRRSISMISRDPWG